jgi:hypothetical protein
LSTPVPKCHSPPCGEEGLHVRCGPPADTERYITTATDGQPADGQRVRASESECAGMREEDSSHAHHSHSGR